MAVVMALEEAHNAMLVMWDMQSLAHSYKVNLNGKQERYKMLDVTFARESSIVMRGSLRHKKVVAAKVCGVPEGT